MVLLVAWDMYVLHLTPETTQIAAPETPIFLTTLKVYTPRLLLLQR